MSEARGKHYKAVYCGCNGDMMRVRLCPKVPDLMPRPTPQLSMMRFNIPQHVKIKKDTVKIVDVLLP